MPKQIKKKITKKTTIQEDEVKNGLMRILDVVKGRRKEAAIALSVVIGILAIYIFSSFYSASSREKAYALEMEAYNYYYGVDIKAPLTEKEKWQKALELYKKSVEIKASPTARFYLGNCYYNLGDYNNAIKEYTSFVDKFSSEEAVLPMVYQKLASAYFKINDNDRAVETLGHLARLGDGIFRDTALVLEARYYNSAGMSDKAIEKYKELTSLFPASIWSYEANAKIYAEDTEGSKEKKEEEPQEIPEKSDSKINIQPETK